MRIAKWFGFAILVGILGVGVGVGLRLADMAKSLPGLDWMASEKTWAQVTPAQTVPAAAGRLPAAGSVPNLGAARPDSPRHTVVVDVAQRVSPAVVSIGASKKTFGRQYDPYGGDPYFSMFQILPLTLDFPYMGSGFIIDKTGHVITNYHVIENASAITVTLPDRRTFQARLLDADRYVDIALLQIEGLKRDESLPTIPLGNSGGIMIGETVLAIGNPFGPLIADPRPSVSVGVVSAVNRSFKLDENSRAYQNMIQTDAAINPGNSGGPLVNLDGEVIGINTFIFSRSGDSTSVGFSIPVNRATRVAQEILKYGKLRTIRLDFEPWNLNASIQQALGLKTDKGALIRSVDVGGPADRAGLQPGDVIVGVDGNEISDVDSLLSDFLTRTVGETIQFQIVRGGKDLTLDYKVEEGKR
ncbi:MAG: trypsin-like peptidase domain-containing protein [bacterium]|nr:trypsin-like peptidase domain-containing protein [bacterium]